MKACWACHRWSPVLGNLSAAGERDVDAEAEGQAILDDGVGEEEVAARRDGVGLDLVARPVFMPSMYDGSIGALNCKVSGV